MRLKIESDGTSFGTRVVDLDSGQELEGIREVEWSWERGYGATVRISIEDVATAVTAPLSQATLR